MTDYIAQAQTQSQPQSQGQPATPPDEALLQDMRDIHEPEPVGSWPPAPGWWLLTFVLLFVLIYLYLKAARHNRKRAYRREAAQELMMARERYRSSGDVSAYAQEILELLKRTALTAYPNDHKRIAGLHGEAWLKFLDSTCPNCKFNSAEGRNLLKAAYSDSGARDGETGRNGGARGDKSDRGEHQGALQDNYVQAKLWIVSHRSHGGQLSA